MKYTLVDGFSGAGGLSLGLQRSGFDVILSFDNDESSIETQKINTNYFRHNSTVKDVKELLKKNNFLDALKLKRGELFMLAGGPPCQGFSIQRIGDNNDERNDLVLKYAELINKATPAFFLLENVPGLLGHRGKPIFDKFLKRVDKIGYKTYYKVLNAEDYGVPQRRKRVFVVGVRKDLGDKEFKFPNPIKLERRKTVRDAIFGLPTPPDNGKDHPDLKHHRRDRLSPINLARINALKPGQGMEYLPARLLAECHKMGANKVGHRNVYGRMAWDEVAPTIIARFDSFTRGKFGHPVEARSITLREGALLQTFPKDFIFCGTKVDIARQIGNAVPPRLAEVVGRQILAYYLSIKK